MNDLMFERVFSPIGIGKDDLVWRKNAYRPHEIDGIERREFGSGISANAEALSRFGYLYLREGRWRDHQILPKDFIKAAGTTDPAVEKLPVANPDEYGNASQHYGLLWWNNADGTLAGVPRDAYWTWGLYDSLVVVMPSLDVVAVRTGKSWKRDEGAEHYAVLKPFLRPIAQSVR
jgi:CubicO group peptidase (beta-lactamase class C family)